jgi:transposase-like protein
MSAPAKIEDICNSLAEGKSLRAIAKEMGKAESTLRYWIAKDPEAFAHSARAKDLGCDSLADECLEIADDPTIEPTEKKIRIDTRIRLIGKWSQRYNDKLIVENKTEVTHKYDLDSLSDKELDAFETLASKAAVTSGDQGSEGEAAASSVH